MKNGNYVFEDLTGIWKPVRSDKVRGSDNHLFSKQTFIFKGRNIGKLYMELTPHYKNEKLMGPVRFGTPDRSLHVKKRITTSSNE